MVLMFRKFFIQDTNSSNGTFLNGERLSDAGVASEPFELIDGDILVMQLVLSFYEQNLSVCLGIRDRCCQ